MGESDGSGGEGIGVEIANGGPTRPPRDDARPLTVKPLSLEESDVFSHPIIKRKTSTKEEGHQQPQTSAIRIVSVYPASRVNVKQT